MSEDLEGRFVKSVCLSCGQKLEFPDEMAGRQIACPTCSADTKLMLHIPQSNRISILPIVVLMVLVMTILGALVLLGVSFNHAARQPQPISPALQEDYAAYEKANQNLIKTYEDELRLEDRLLGVTETDDKIHARAVKIVQDEVAGKPFIRSGK